MFFNAGRKVDPVFESKNIMVDWWFFFLFIWPAECRWKMSLRDDLRRRDKSDFDFNGRFYTRDA